MPIAPSTRALLLALPALAVGAATAATAATAAAPAPTAATAAAAAPPTALAPGDHRIALQFGGLDRSYLVHVPPASTGAAQAARLPLVMNFHGALSTAAGEERFSGMDALADRKGFLVIYPEGTGRLAEFHFWNAGNCCGSAAIEGVDDVGFAMAVLDDAERRLAIDPERVYVAGMSNGGMMAHRLAAAEPKRIAAMASVAGGMMFDAPPGGGPPMPVLQFHSVDDPIVPYHGGASTSPIGRGDVMHQDIEAVMRRWAEHDGCEPAPKTLDTQRTPNGQTATHLVWRGCRDGAEVSLWRLTATGHVWPGSPAHRPGLLGPDTEVIDANRVIWDFFSRFKRPQSTSPQATGNRDQTPAHGRGAAQ